MHLFTGHRPECWRFFAKFELPTHVVCWLRGHRAKAEVIEPEYSMDPWILIICRTCWVRHGDPYLSIQQRLSRDEAKAALAGQVHAARTNNVAYAKVRDGRDGYGHRNLELSLEITRKPSYLTTGFKLHIGDRWSETPFDGSVTMFRRTAYFSVGGVGHRLAQWLAKGKKVDIRLGSKYKELD